MGALWQSEPTRTEAPETSPAEAPLPKTPRQRRLWWRLIVLIVLLAAIVIGFAAYDEMRTSKLQSREFSRLAGTLTYSLEPGPSDAIIYPGDGPFDKRLGYSALGEFLPRLLKRDYLISQQVRFSPALMNYVEHGLFVPYVEKIQAGLSITDCRGQDLYHYNYPQHLYPDFASIPPIIVKSLLFIENRDLLDPQDPRNNPAVDWPRFAKAAYSQVAKYLALPGQSAGGSTLATQLEKYRHSPDGINERRPARWRRSPSRATFTRSIRSATTQIRSPAFAPVARRTPSISSADRCFSTGERMPSASTMAQTRPAAPRPFASWTS